MRELRSASLNLSTPDDEHPRRLVGTAIVYDQVGQVLDFREVIRRGAFTTAIQQAGNIRLLFEHRATNLLASTQNQTLQLIDSPEGLKFVGEAAETSVGDDVLSLVRAGELRGCSFSMVVDRDGGESYQLIDGEPTRVITRIKRIDELTLTSDPFYLGTTVEQRSVDPEAIAAAAALSQQHHNELQTREQRLRRVRAAV